MSAAYVRSTYRLPKVKRGLKVVYRGVEGKITSFSNYVHIRLNGEKKTIKAHPKDEQLKYIYS